MFRKVLEKAILDADNIALKLREEYDGLLKKNSKCKTSIPKNLKPIKNRKKKSKLVQKIHNQTIKNHDINTVTKNAEINLTRLGIDVSDFKNNIYTIYDYNSVFVLPYSKLKRPNTAPQTIMELVYHSHKSNKLQ